MTTDLVISEDWSPKVGGAHFWLENTYRRWPSPVEILTATRLPNITKEVIETDVSENRTADLKVKRILASVPTVSLRPNNWHAVLANVLKVRRSLPMESARIHCKAYFPEGLIGSLAKLSSKKVSKLIVYAHGEEINVANASRMLRIIAKWVYNSADIVITNSHNTEQKVLALAPGSITTVIHPGVDVAMVRSACEKRVQTRCKYGWTEERFVVLTIARLEARKNVCRVIDALHSLRQGGKPIEYIVVGDGETRPAIQKKIEDLEAQDWVTLIERVTEQEKIELLNTVDLFIMASVTHGLMVEGFGIVFLEAAAAGLLSISGKDGGQCEAVLDGVTGFNVDGNSIDAIKNGVDRVMSDKRKAFLMQVEAKKWAEQNDWSEIVAKTISVV